MNLWGRGSPRFPFIQPMQGAMDFAAYEQFPFQNPAWDVAHPGNVSWFQRIFSV